MVLTKWLGATSSANGAIRSVKSAAGPSAGGALAEAFPMALPAAAAAIAIPCEVWAGAAGNFAAVATPAIAQPHVMNSRRFIESF